MADTTAGAYTMPDRAQRMRVSVLLQQLKQDVPAERFTFGWLVDYLRARAPEVLILFLALVGVLPGVSFPVGILIAILSVTVMSTKTGRLLPAFIASQPLPSAHFVHAIDKSMPVFEWGERYTRPRDAAMTERLRPFAGVAILLLSVTLLVPLPLSNVIPSLSIGLIAFACIESDGLLLVISMMAAVASLAITSATVWAALGAAAWMWA
ncbi:MAG: exopolysaccharide biosynthesis protein [Rhizomicrobium sp.]|jgi:hypothetical protein